MVETVRNTQFKIPILTKTSRDKRLIHIVEVSRGCPVKYTKAPLSITCINATSRLHSGTLQLVQKNNETLNACIFLAHFQREQFCNYLSYISS